MPFRDSGILKKSPAPIPDAFKWVNDLSLRRGTWAVCYTYVLGRRDEEWQQSPLVTLVATLSKIARTALTWAYKKGTVLSGENQYSGIHDPQFESAPSPITTIKQSDESGDAAAWSSRRRILMPCWGLVTLRTSGTGVRASGFATTWRTLMPSLKVSVSLTTSRPILGFTFFCEVEPTFDMVTTITSTGVELPEEIGKLGTSDSTAARIVWTGKELYDYHRTLKHSTGYYAWKVFLIKTRGMR